MSYNRIRVSVNFFKKIANRVTWHIKISDLKDESRKLGINFMTAGIVGAFITNHLHLDDSVPAIWLTLLGIVFVLGGAIRKKEIL